MLCKYFEVALSEDRQDMFPISTSISLPRMRLDFWRSRQAAMTLAAKLDSRNELGMDKNRADTAEDGTADNETRQY